MEQTQKKIIVRDNRRRQMFRVDDEYIDRYARLCGVNATAVYMSLCRHVNGKQESFPSLQRIMEQHDFGSHNTVRKAIKILEEYGIISVKREKDTETKRQMVNVYTLMDVSSWLDPMSKNDTGADVILNTDPVSFRDKKPVSPNDKEGNTEEKVTHRRIVADATEPPVTTQKCGYEACTKTPIKKSTGEYLEMCKDHQPMNCQEFVEWYRKDSRRYINLIAELADEVRPMFKTVIQWEVWASQHYKAAVQLQAFDDTQISAAFKELKGSDYVTTFNLYTVLKFLTNAKK